jgi:hypothetical protein
MNETIAQFIPAAIWIILSIIPAIKLLGRLGKSRWWAAITLVPVLGIVILLWIVAYSRWPLAEDSRLVRSFE